MWLKWHFGENVQKFQKKYNKWLLVWCTYVHCWTLLINKLNKPMRKVCFSMNTQSRNCPKVNKKPLNINENWVSNFFLLLTHICHMISEDLVMYTVHNNIYLLFSEIDRAWSPLTFNLWKRAALTFCKTSTFVFYRRMNDIRVGNWWTICMQQEHLEGHTV